MGSITTVSSRYLDRLEADNERLREVLKGIAVTTCREWIEAKADCCNAPAEFILWGKLIPPDGLGPKCYDHAAAHVGHRALGDPSWAIVDLRPARTALGIDENCNDGGS